jgi:hypothetical protein
LLVVQLGWAETLIAPMHRVTKKLSGTVEAGVERPS